MNDLELGIDFSFNATEAHAETERIKNGIASIGKTSEEAAAKLANVKKMVQNLADAEQNKQAILAKYEKMAQESAEIYRKKQQESKNNIKETTESVLGLKKASEENNKEQEESTSTIGDLVGGMFSWASILTVVGGFLINNRAEIIAWVKEMWTGVEVNKELEAAQKAVNKSLQDASTLIAKEIAEINISVDKINDKNISLEKRGQLLDEFILQSPAVLGALTLQNIETLKGKDLIDDYIASLKKKIELQQLEKGYSESLQKTADIESGKEDTEISTVATSLLHAKNILTFRKITDTEKEIEAASKRLKNNALNEQSVIAKTYEDKIKAILAGESKIKTVEDNSIKSREERLSVINNRLLNLQKGESDKALNAEKAQLQKEIKERRLALGLDKPDKPKKEAIDATVNERKSLIRQLTAIDAEYTRKSFSKNDEEVRALEDKFSRIRNLILDFNKKYPKKAISLVEFNELEETSTDDLRYRQQTNQYKSAIDEQKTLYADYEAYKSEFGAAKAKERYAGLLDLEKTHLQKLQIGYAITLAQGYAGGFTPVIQERLAMQSKAIKAETKAEQKRTDDALKEFETYQQKRTRIQDKYLTKANEFRKNKQFANADEATQQGVEEIKALDKTNIEKWASYKKLFENIKLMNREQTLEAIRQYEIELKAFVGDAAVKAAKIAQLKALKKAIKDDDTKALESVLGVLSQIGAEFSNINSTLGNTFNVLLKSAGSYLDIKKASAEFNREGATESEKFEAGANLVATGVSAATSLIGMFINASKARNEAEKQYYASVIAFQNDYNLSLNEEIRLRTQLSDNVFVKDLKGKITDGTAALVDANAKYLKSLQDLQNGQAKLGQRNVVDPKSLIGGAASGAVLGATIGSVVPVIGTAIGAVVGGIAGLIGGLFGGKKKKDVFGGLLQEYPELIQKASDGTLKFNEALAKSLVANNLVDDKTKALLQNTIALAEARKAALEQINSVISDLAGTLGDDLRNTLVDAFRTGENSALAFGKTVSGVLENIVSQMLFSAVFGDSFDKLQKEMKESYDIGGDGSFVDDITRFFKQAGPGIDAFNQGLKAAQEEAAKQGLNLFGNTASGSKDTGIKSEIRDSITENTGSEIVGINRANYEVHKQNLAVSRSILASTEKIMTFSDNGLAELKASVLSLHNIEQHTGNTVAEAKNIVEEIKKLNKNMTPQGSRATS